MYLKREGCKSKDWIKRSLNREGPVADSCEYGNESSACINGGKFLGQLSYYQLLKNNCVPCS
jgi:hypothetical protein